MLKTRLFLLEGASSRMQLNADVVFLMDASTAENTRYFQSQKDLIKSIARSIGSSPAKLRASLVIYSSSATVLASLNSYTNLQRFEVDVDRAPYLRGMYCHVHEIYKRNNNGW